MIKTVLFREGAVEYQLRPFSYTSDTENGGRESLRRIMYIFLLLST